jgi:hypothetical protein
MKENGPVDVLISDWSCYTLCVGIMYWVLRIAEYWRAMYSDVLPVDDVMLRYQRYY